MNTTYAAFIASLTIVSLAIAASPDIPSDGQPLWLRYPAISPDGTQIAFTYGGQLWRVPATGGEAVALTTGEYYTASPVWAPDGSQIAFASKRHGNLDVFIMPAKGGDIARLTQNSADDRPTAFSPDGSLVYFASSRLGSPQSLHLAAYEGSEQLYAVPARGGRSLLVLPTPALVAQPDATGQRMLYENRSERDGDMDIFQATLDDASMKDFSAPGQIIEKKLVDTDGDLMFPKISPDGKLLADSLSGAALEKTDLATGITSAIPLDTHMDVDPRGELTYWFTHFWRLTKFKFYEPTMHGRDWDALRAHYARFLPHLQTWEDFAEMMSELAGELNASHMGCYYLKPMPNAADTASLGIHTDDTHTGEGLRVAAVLPGGPADLTGSPLTPAAVILAINGETIKADTDSDALLDGIAGTKVELLVQPVDASTPVKQTLVPITLKEAFSLASERWVEERKAMTEKLSGGRLGYIFLPEMSTEAYKRAYSEVTGDFHDKEGLVIDIRYNMGGNIHDQLITLFTGDVYAGFTTRDGRVVGRMPTGRWSKPTALLQNASAYSDGSIFPHLYKSGGLGPIVGDNVPGTGTAVWWMYPMKATLKWGVPQLGAKDFKTGWFENSEIVPDVLVRNDPASIAAGKDPQLEATVAKLLQQLKKP